MRNINPIRLLIIGSAVTAAAIFICLATLHLANIPFGILFSLAIAIISGGISFLIFYFIFKTYVTERLRILYRSIRKGKFNGQIQSKFKLTEDIITNAEEETKKWTDACSALE